ncbi:MAG: pyrophosphatase [Candidatus Roizmanbacteria bacterium]
MNLDELTIQLEKISKHYATNYDINRSNEWFLLKLQEEMGELIQSYLMKIKQARTKGKTESELNEDFANELADVLAHTLLLAHHNNINISQAIEIKWLSWINKGNL